MSTVKTPLELLAERKRIPLNFWRRAGYGDFKHKPKDEVIVDGAKQTKIPPGDIHITYTDSDGTKKRTQIRSSKGTWLWADDGSGICPFGSHFIPRWIETGITELSIGEGCSDAVTAWFNHIAHLAVPGKSTSKHLRLEHVQWVNVIYLSFDNDTGGDEGAPKTFEHLRKIGYTGSIRRLRPRLKDISDDYVSDPDGFKALWEQLKQEAGEMTETKPLTERQTDDDEDEAEEIAWNAMYPPPRLHPDALHGVIGDIIRAALPQTEASAAGILTTLLPAIGNAAGDQRYALAGNAKHPARLYMSIVGKTSGGGKGSAWDASKPFLRMACKEWYDNCIKRGFGSGEAIISELSGETRQEGEDKNTKVFIREIELVKTLIINKRDGSTSAGTLCEAWDEDKLEARLSNKRRVAENVNIALYGHITPEALLANLSPHDITGGFGNRTMWMYSKSSKILDDPQPLDAAIIEPLAKRVNAAIVHAQMPLRLIRTAEAKELWQKLISEEPSLNGILGDLTARFRANSLRLQVFYAIADCADEIRIEHVKAAHAVWSYARDSVLYLYGAKAATRTEERLLDHLRIAFSRGRKGLTTTEIDEVFKSNARPGQLLEARRSLLASGLIRVEEEPSASGKGRRKRLWFAIPPQPPENTEKTEEIPHPALSSVFSVHNEDESNSMAAAPGVECELIEAEV